MIQIGTTTFTGLYDPVLNDHLSRALTLYSRRRNRNVVCNLPILSLDYFDGSFHNNTGRLKRVDPFSPAEEAPTSSTTIQQQRAHFEKCLLKFVGNACTDKT
ncbi:MAG TPA: hypothetical protein VJ875_15030 [Pyrinomonadaceae bacterium]|nr:hypothetical protein [Pyrinomonadaceae bacterium]